LTKIFKKPLKIGLTGGIGTGKTTISQILSSLGIPIFNADNCSKNLLQTNQNIIKTITKQFGTSIVEKNQINTKKLGKIVFSNKKKLAILNNIIHPIVLKQFHQWVSHQNTKYIIKESAILFESESYKTLDKIILVKAPLKLRIQRVKNRDQRNLQEINAIINNQFKTNHIIKHIDYIINNNENNMLTPQVISLHHTLSIL